MQDHLILLRVEGTQDLRREKMEEKKPERV